MARPDVKYAVPAENHAVTRLVVRSTTIAPPSFVPYGSPWSITTARLRPGSIATSAGAKNSKPSGSNAEYSGTGDLGERGQTDHREAGQDSGKAERHRGLTGRQPLVHDDHAIVGDVEGDPVRTRAEAERERLHARARRVSDGIDATHPHDGHRVVALERDGQDTGRRITVDIAGRADARVGQLDPTLADDGESEKILRTLHGPTSTEAE